MKIFFRTRTTRYLTFKFHRMANAMKEDTQTNSSSYAKMKRNIHTNAQTFENKNRLMKIFYSRDKNSFGLKYDTTGIVISNFSP